MTDDDELIADFLKSLGPVDESKRPPGWPTRHRVGLIFPPVRRPGEPAVATISASIHLSNLQALFVRRAALAAGIDPAAWCQRHLLAAAGCPPPRVGVAPEILERVYTNHADLDALLSAVRKQ
ncbi:hypothetical protein [Devosia sp. A369]